MEDSELLLMDNDSFKRHMKFEKEQERHKKRKEILQEKINVQRNKISLKRQIINKKKEIKKARSSYKSVLPSVKVLEKNVRNYPIGGTLDKGSVFARKSSFYRDDEYDSRYY